jgi:stage V sporulation protein G
MEITSVKIRKVERENSRMKGIASVVIDDAIAIHDIRIIEGDSNLFIAMPSRKTPAGEYRDIVHPINQEVRTMFEKEILDAYEKAEDVTEEAREEE